MTEPGKLKISGIASGEDLEVRSVEPSPAQEHEGGAQPLDSPQGRMSPHQKVLTPWNEWVGADRYSDENLHRMCDDGAAQVRDGRFGAVRFNCMNEREVQVVSAYMASRHPDVEFTTTMLRP